MTQFNIFSNEYANSRRNSSFIGPKHYFIDDVTIACSEANLTDAQQRQRISALSKLQARYDNFINSMKLIETRL
jgi:hypothetical protein